jgi:hypothetical protein
VLKENLILTTLITRFGVILERLKVGVKIFDHPNNVFQFDVRGWVR